MKTILEAHTLLKEKKVSSQELTLKCLEVAEKNENNAYICVLKESALLEAKKVDEKISRQGVSSYLEGIPFSLKDLFITKNIRTTGGSKILHSYTPPYDGYVSERLKESSGVLLGKNGCDEFGMGSSNEQTPFGKVRLPLNPDFVPGGSSGGSAVSVLEGSSYYSMGTDTGGSVRLPANFCGLVGFKPSYGRISRYGQLAYGSSLDQAAPFTRTPLDAAMIVDELTVNDQRDSTQAPSGRLNATQAIFASKGDLSGKTIGYSKELLKGCREDVLENLELALKNFEKLGAKIVNIDLPHLKYSVAVYYLIATSEASSNLARYDGIHFGFSGKEGKDLLETYKKSRSQGFGAEVKRRILLGTFALSSGYSSEFFSKAAKARRLIFNDFQNAFSECDFIFSPVCATTSFRSSDKIDPLKMYLNDLYTIPVNLAGLPSIALPFGRSNQNSLPTGFQLIGNSFQDKDLLVSAHKFFNSDTSLQMNEKSKV